MRRMFGLDQGYRNLFLNFKGINMSWQEIEIDHINQAMSDCDTVGIDAFRSKHGDFQPAKNIRMYLGNRGPYEARPLIAAAYAIKKQGARLSPKNFKNNNGHNFLVQKFEFTIIKLK